MPLTASTIRTLSRDITVERGEDVDVAMRRIDQAETEAVCRHLLGDLPGSPTSGVSQGVRR